MIELNGADGEGGGQILRGALALSMATGQPFRVTNVRAGRAKPGLLRQHLTALRAAGEIASASITGDELGSRTVTFSPRAVRAGAYRFSIGAAGSTSLVLQAVFPALALLQEASELVIEGGTHNPAAPPFEFLTRTLLPFLSRAGFAIRAELEEPGFYPAGGGRLRVGIGRCEGTRPLELLERGGLRAREVTALVAQLPRSIGQREVEELRRWLAWEDATARVESIERADGPGNVVCAAASFEHVTEVFTGFGTKGVPAELVARNVASEAAEYVQSTAPVGRHLADQLVIPLALGSGGVFRTLSPSLHTRSQVALVREFLGAEVRCVEEANGAWRMEVPARR